MATAQAPIHFKEAQTGSHEGPIPTSTPSPAPTIHGLGGPIRRIVGASGERTWGWDPCGRPSDVQSPPISLFEMYCAQALSSSLMDYALSGTIDSCFPKMEQTRKQVHTQ